MTFDDLFACPKQGPDDGLWIRTIGGVCPCQTDGPAESGYKHCFRCGKWIKQAERS